MEKKPSIFDKCNVMYGTERTLMWYLTVTSTKRKNLRWKKFTDKKCQTMEYATFFSLWIGSQCEMFGKTSYGNGGTVVWPNDCYLDQWNVQFPPFSVNKTETKTSNRFFFFPHKMCADIWKFFEALVNWYKTSEIYSITKLPNIEIM